MVGSSGTLQRISFTMHVPMSSRPSSVVLQALLSRDLSAACVIFAITKHIHTDTIYIVERRSNDVYVRGKCAYTCTDVHVSLLLCAYIIDYVFVLDSLFYTSQPIKSFIYGGQWHDSQK